MRDQSVTAKQYYDTNAKIIAVFEQMEQIVDSIDQAKNHGSALRNPTKLFPIAEKIIVTMSDAAHLIHEAYVAHIQGEDTPAHTVCVIEAESWKIFNAIKTVIFEARRLEVDPLTNQLSHSADAYYDDLEIISQKTVGSHEAIEQRPSAYPQKGAVQTAIIREARRLGPEYGSNFLLAVDDTFLAMLTMLKSIKACGIAIDLKQLPNIETNPENWLEPSAGLKAKEDDITTSVRHLAILMQVCRTDAMSAWATKRIH